MQVFVSREGQTSGPYSVDQIKDYLDQGILFPHDLAYHEGLENWTALSEIIKVESPAIPITEPAPIHAEKPPTAIKPKPKQKIVIAVAAVIAILGVVSASVWFLMSKKDQNTQAQKGPEAPIKTSPNPEPTTPEPTTPEPMPNGSNRLNLSVSRHVLLIKPDGTLWSWGKQLFGEFGHGKTGLQEQESPKQVGEDNDWVSIEAAEYMSFGIKKDGSLWAWGRDYDAFPKRIYPDQKWKSIAAHEDLLVATTTEGEIYSSKHYSSNDISPIIGGPRNSKWINLTAGYRHFLGITANGDLWTWGKGGMSNHCGQMGLGNKNPPPFDLSPIKIGEDSNWASVSAKGNHSLAIKKDGTIWAWGHNHSGQVGNGSRSFDGVLKPVQIGRENTWKFISAGKSFSTAIKSDGTIWGWGSNITKPTNISSDSDWIGVCAGAIHTLALKRDQTLWLFDTSTLRGMTEPPVKILDLTPTLNASAPPKNTNPTENPSTKISLSTATKDQPFTNSLGMKFVPIPGTDLFFSIYETRTSEYKKFIVESGKGFNFGNENETANADYPARASRNGGSGKDANTEFFCAWLTERDRKLGKLSKDWEYRLPTIEEWKTAAALDSVEVNNQATSDDKNLKAVGSGKPNKFGLYDVAGNAWELTLDNASKSLTKMAALVGGSPRPLAGGYTNGAEGFRCIIAKVKE